MRRSTLSHTIFLRFCDLYQETNTHKVVAHVVVVAVVVIVVLLAAVVVVVALVIRGI